MTNHKFKKRLSNFVNTLKTSSLLHDKNKSKTEALIILISAILNADPLNTDNDIDFVISFLCNKLPELNASTIRTKLNKKHSLYEIIEAATSLCVLESKEKESILLSLLETSLANGQQTPKEKRIISVIAGEMNVNPDTLNSLYSQALKSSIQKKKILNSAAGLILAICIIILFLFAATYLKSVLFGLILACFCLPLQDCIYKNVVKSKFSRFISRTFKLIFSPITFPLKNIKKLILKNSKQQPEHSTNKELKYISYSCTTTVFSVIVLMLVVLTSLSWFSTSCFATLTNSVSSWVEKTSNEYQQQHPDPQSDQLRKNLEKETNIKMDNNSSVKHLIDAMLFKLESFKPMLENTAIFKFIKKALNETLKSKEAKEGLPAFLLSKSGGIFSLTTGAIGSIASFLMDLVFTFFFFAFFLGQMAKLNYKINGRMSPGQHIVRGISSSGWFPILKAETLNGTTIIIDDILTKLKAWIRGYLSIIIIETLFYVTTFILTGVPYAIGLGILAGLTILLPYIGPVISVLLTVSVCLVFGTAGMIQVFIVILLYLIMNGVCEQLFLYPAIVGSALGLNEFETIIVVLLGGILAGITGLIFAVPVAAILKYLIPKAYSVISTQKAQII